MWPILLDMTKEESMQHLRCLEIDAFSGLVSALRAQGSLDNEKLKVLKDTGAILHISQERHKAEVRRVVNDEKLNTIAYHVNGEKHCGVEWAEEGQRLIPLMTRVAPQTAYSALADEVADTASKINKQLPAPASTERKRPPPISPTHANASTSDQASKSLQFRINEPIKSDESKKRKLSTVDNSNMAQHLIMGPPKFSRIQQIYRQRTKVKQTKEQVIKMKPDLNKPEYVHIQQVAASKPVQQQVIQSSPKALPKLSVNSIQPSTSVNSPKINILQNISIQAALSNACEELKAETNILAVPTSSNELDIKEINPQSINLCDTQSPKIINKLITNAAINKSNQVTIKTMAGSSEIQKTIKVCAPRKTITSKTVTTSSGQKLIVVSNPQTLSTSSILQRTLTIPFKNLSAKNFDKFKIVTSTCNSTQQPITAPIQIQNSKQKVVTVRTTANKKMIPFSQVQVLNTKGGIKVLPLPLGGKIISKSNTNMNSMYVMNTADTEICGTKSTTSTPILMSSKTQDNPAIRLKELEINSLPTADAVNTSEESTNDILENINLNMTDEKSSVLADIMEKSGLITTDAIYTDFENQIKQHLVPIQYQDFDADHIKVNTISKIEPTDSNANEELDLINSDECYAHNDHIKIDNDVDSYIILDGEHEHTSDDLLLEGLDIDQPMEVLNIVGSLDPITGQYSITDSEQETMSVVESHILETETPEDHMNAINN